MKNLMGDYIIFVSLTPTPTQHCFTLTIRHSLHFKRVDSNKEDFFKNFTGTKYVYNWRSTK